MTESDKLTILPGYFAKKMLYPSTTELRLGLGTQDACIQLQELASRVLEEQANIFHGGPEAFLKANFSKMGISHGSYEFGNVKVVIAQSHVAQTYNYFEKFVKDLSREYRAHKWIDASSWKRKNDDLEEYSAFHSLCYNLPTIKGTVVLGKPESELMEYYRAVRVSSTHPSEENKKKAEAIFASLQTRNKDYFQKTYNLEAPNAPDNIVYADFCLFTRAVKYYSNTLNDACDLTDHDIKKYATLVDRNIFTCVRGKTNDHSKILSVQGYLQKKYSLSDGMPVIISDDELRIIEGRSEIASELDKLDVKGSSTRHTTRCDKNGEYILVRIDDGKETMIGEHLGFAEVKQLIGKIQGA